MNSYYIELSNRGVIRISGPDRRPFLQGLISNDIYLLDKQPCVYSCFLTPQGKFLHDFFITESTNVITLECEGGVRAADLAKRLLMFKLRAKVEITCEKNIDVYVICPPHPPADAGPSLSPRGEGWGEGDQYLDPRHPSLGYRSFAKPNFEEKPFDVWDHNRIMLAIPDGSRDMIVDKSTLLESNVDKLNGISWDKGCYMGQELTARMHYRALVKKRLQTVKLNEIPEDADLRSSCGDVGIALMKLEN